MNPLQLIEIAANLAKGVGTKPRQAELRRAISTAYYAMFHFVAKSFADALNGTSSTERNNVAWTQAYRSLSHTQISNCCKRKDIQQDLPPEICQFCIIFNRMQLLRNEADYNPDMTFYRLNVLS